MSSEVRNLAPKALWENFADLNAVPRPSKKEERVIRFMKEFGRKLGLETLEDETGNVIIKKPATPGMENRQTVAMQSHLDMVHQKNNDTAFDFDTQGIDMYVDEDWVRARGTTLGADNGIGVATIMAILASKDIPHPAIEALFTIDEETGMTGALGLKGGLLDASILLNLDTEDDRELTIGCAGGVDVTATGTYTQEATPAGMAGYKLIVKGLTGGHSGMDIILGRGNANKLVNRLLHNAVKQFGLRVSSIDGGGLRNAIPRESSAIVAVAVGDKDAFEKYVATQKAILVAEYKATDPNLQIVLETADAPDQVANEAFTLTLLRVIYATPNGIYRMSPEIAGLVQTSNNVARVEVKDGSYKILCLTRSSVDSEKEDLATAIQATLELAGAEVTLNGSYPGWAPNPDASIIQLMSDLYRSKFNSEPEVSACHAGLECGILGANYPGMEMISFGPNIRGAHSPDEKVQISSVQKYWDFLLDTLQRIPEKV
ncbi:aminoacyl-histidine dipeptidase [Pontibacter akesuensis]|uniref:Cytosol non-specific dipeptidase n=1 Tax=Pontibacter akesuensis TaxID=388950 RepID=A0A1I7KWB3_9BACT|nr:aminoacyl-histidine dipeptidase [Pontibacter akesuensis]GHA80540.1 aminoacyl-histidine dipeptidase [Pontibacter akesuensis]SFV01763.1 dipeptidase D [Pontibacter akesuensis]